MLNLNSSLCAAREAGVQELLNLTHLKFVPISTPALLIHWFKAGMCWPFWAGRLHSKTCLQRECLVLVYKQERPLGPKSAWWVCAKGHSGLVVPPISPLCPGYPSSSVLAQPRAATGQLLGTAPHPALVERGVHAKVETKMFAKTHPWSPTRTEPALNSVTTPTSLESKSTSTNTRAEI